MKLRVALFAVLLTCGACIAFAQKSAANSRCAAESKSVLGDQSRILKSGNLLGDGTLLCVAVVPHAKRSSLVLSSRGVVVQWDGKQWHQLLRFEHNVTNDHGYIGIDFIDCDANYGFALETEDQRSDGTRGFTIYFSYLNAKLQPEPESLPIQVSWNPKVRRFQEYAPNELDPPDFKHELRNPPIRKGCN
jgi:hypothetical protein